MAIARRHRNRCLPFGTALRGLALGGCCLLVGLAAAVAPAAETGTAAEPFTRGAAAVEQGRLETAIEAWSAAERRAAAAGDTATRMEALLRRAEAYQTLGRLDRAVGDLLACRTLAAGASDGRRRATAGSMLGAIYLMTGDTDQAGPLLEESLDLAERQGLTAVAATTLANLGLLMTARQQSALALTHFDRSLAMASRLGDPALLATVQIGRARAALAADWTDLAATALAAAGTALARLEPSAEKARLLVAQAASLLRLQEWAARSEPARRRSIYESLREAIETAGRFSDRRTLAFAYGHLGRLYEVEQRTAEALELTRTAVWLAQQTGEPAILYQWHWQAGRLLRALGRSEPALEAYQRAAATLHDVGFRLRQAPDALGGSFRQTVGPLYVELADLLLRRADAAGRQTEAEQKDLRDARAAIEQLKTTEWEDYFHDECVDNLLARQRGIDPLLPEHTAALYPILLPDRTALILSVGDTLQQFTVPAGAADVAKAVNQLRQRLEQVTTREYLPAAQEVYRLLIRPVERVLVERGVDTLVFVPDGPLRTIPIAALHDGQSFVAERYATVVVPGLTLLDSQPISRQEVSVLLNALTKGVQGYPSLPHVADEVKTVEQLFDDRQVLENQDFVTQKMQLALDSRPFNVVHIASHGEFGREAEASYLLTFDSRLTLKDLETFIKRSRFRSTPVELLILSACQTATGDDRAALGLAGIAVKAGARSAVASLWFVNDQAAAALVSEFYRQLETQSSKAQSLRHAQLSLIRDPRFDHPGYWSPFLLIGNWR